MAVLLIAEIAGDSLVVDTTARALTAARELGEVTILVAAGDAGAAAESAAGLDGAAMVLRASGPDLAHGLAEPLAELIVAQAGAYDHVVAASSALSKGTLPRVAAMLDAMVIPDVTKIVSADTFERPVYAGNAIQTVRSRDAKKVLSVRGSAYAPAGAGTAAAPIEDITPAEPARASIWVEDSVAESSRPELASARIVVSGGRALGSAEGFKLVEDLADSLGAAVGASRAAVDAGYVPSDLQVGQTGKVVAPDLYIAIGISGAIQHLAGMKDSRVIVAINKDADAPIFQVADYGLVADLFEAVPELQRALAGK